VLYALLKNLSKKLGLFSLKLTIILVKTKKGNITGRIFIAHTDIAFKHEFA